MKVRYKITAVFVLMMITVLAATCALIYMNTMSQQRKDFNTRLYNRALTVATLLSRLPSNGYDLLSRLDSSTTNLLVNENIHVYDEADRLLYRFDRDPVDTVVVDTALVEEARVNRSAPGESNGKGMMALYSPGALTPIVVVTAARDQTGAENMHDLTQSLIIAFVTGVLLAFLTGLVFSKQLLAPLERIADTVNSISVNNIEARLPASDVNDEWNKLALTFNNLLNRLQDSFEIQGRFISNASHELSTPLTAIINQLEVTMQNKRSANEYLEVITSVNADVKHLADLTQHLLTLARSARGGSFKTSQVRIDEMLMDIPSLIRQVSADYTVLVHFDELPDDERRSMIHGNSELLLSAFRNIAENGCKYSPDHTVRIALSFVAGKIIILFSNHLTYFNPADLDTIFQPFQRGANVSAVPGYGLGLSLTRRILLVHKGEIRAEIAPENMMLITVVFSSIL